MEEILEQVGCDLCGSEDARLRFDAIDWHFECPGRFAIVQCTKCGLSYLNPRPKPAQMGQYYPSIYYTHHDIGANEGDDVEQSGSVTPRVSSNSQSFVKQSVRSVLLGDPCGPMSKFAGWAAVLLQRRKIMTRWRWGLFEDQGRLLDVGCGGGNFLCTLNSDWLLGGRYTTQGIDIDPAAIESAQRIGVRAKVHDFPKTPFGETEFDVVTMRHSLEHMYSPKAAIQEVHRLLRPGGKVVIEVPNLDSWGPKLFRDRWSAADAPRHLYHFTLVSLCKLLEDGGFEVTEQRRWPSTFKGQLSLDNQRRYYGSQGLTDGAIARRILLWRAILAPFDWFTRGGAMSMAAKRK